MAWKDYLSHLFRPAIVADPNLILLKKYLLCVQQGWFRVNGLSPDNQYTVGDYLFDNERVLLDFTHLSDKARKIFNDWFLSPDKDKHIKHWSSIRTNDYRGYTAEVELSWWGRLMNFLFYRKKAYYWPFSSSTARLGKHQLHGIGVYPGENGLFIHIAQNKAKSTHHKYTDPKTKQETPLLNVKRVFLNNELVNQLLKMDLSHHNYDEILANPHPFAIPIEDKGKRFREMQDYRIAEKLIKKQYWYKRLFNFLVRVFFKNNPNQVTPETGYDPRQFKETISIDNTVVLQHPGSGEVIFMEKRPELDSMVFCGGGAKIFAHVGAFKAFEEIGVRPTRYAGSSAGAIMALLAYLGYPSDEIKNFFKQFRQENLVHYEFYQGGISDTQALKAALDFMIIKKIKALVMHYGIDRTVEGENFLVNEVYKKGKITFGSLKALKKRHPDCPLGEELIVTATIKERRATRYFSYERTPDMEISDAVTKSASFPFVFKPTLFEGETYNDGGILSNLPTEVFQEDDSTFLFSEKANYMRLVAFQFDNDGSERNILEKAVERVYRENFLLNWVYGMITGVKDPVSGWERDRLKLLQYSNQIVLIKIGNVSSTQFNLDEKTQEVLLNNGYRDARAHITARYKTVMAPDPEDNSQKKVSVVVDINTHQAINEEGLYMRFASFEELLYFSCFKRCEKWFNRLAQKAIEQGMDVLRIEELRAQYFTEEEGQDETTSNRLPSTPTFFSHQYEVVDVSKIQEFTVNMCIFEVLYPVFLKFIPGDLIKNPKDFMQYKTARHRLNLHRPLDCLTHLGKIQGEVHIVFTLLRNILSTCQKVPLNEVCKKIDYLADFEANKGGLFSDPIFFGKWILQPEQTTCLMQAIKNKDWNEVKATCLKLKNKPPSPRLTPILKKREQSRLVSEQVLVKENASGATLCL